MKYKTYVEIHGEMWEAELPLCAGCPEFIIGEGCGYEGNGCRFPESRVKKPRTFRTGFLVLLEKTKLSPEEARKLEIKFEEKYKQRRKTIEE